MKSNKVIENKREYKNVMAKLEVLMLKGSDNLSESEYAQIRELSLLVQQYEQKEFQVEPPSTIAGMVEWKMYQLKLRQRDLAEILGISPAKLSLIIAGKQKPDVAFLKSVHQKLDVDADFLLEHA